MNQFSKLFLLFKKIHQEIVSRVNLRHSDDREVFDQISEHEMAER